MENATPTAKTPGVVTIDISSVSHAGDRAALATLNARSVSAHLTLVRCGGALRRRRIFVSRRLPCTARAYRTF